jgi:hypothetical protein
LKSAIKEKTKDIRDFEARLAATLKPVTPPDEFVRGLREKLVAQIRAAEPESRLSSKKLVLIVLAGLLSVILIIVAGIRTIVSLILGLRVFSGRRRRSQGDRS